MTLSTVRGVTVVVPVYNGEATVDELLARIGVTLDTVGRDYEVVLVDDESSDASWARIEAAQARHPRLRAFQLMRNSGQHNALLAGVRAARYDVVVTLDDDLQHPPEEIATLLRVLEDGADLVYGTPRESGHGTWRNVSSRLVKFALARATSARTAQSVSAFRAFRTQLRDAFDDFRSPSVSLDVLLSWGTTRIETVPVRHDPRRYGRSGYTFGRLVRHALSMLTGFSAWPLRLASLVGFAFTLLGFALLVYVITVYFTQGRQVPGFAFLASVITLFSGAQLFALGIIGEYLAQAHARLLNRPAYTIRTELPARNWDDASER